jgi:hypothetical protein
MFAERLVLEIAFVVDAFSQLTLSLAFALFVTTLPLSSTI